MMRARALAACAAGALAALCAGCSAPSKNASEHPGAPSPSSRPTVPPITIRSQRVGSRYVYLTKRRKDGGEEYTLRSDANVIESGGSGGGWSTFVNPHIVFVGRTGERLTADARRAVILQQQKSMLMSGDVLARTADGVRLRCDRLRYDEMDERLHGDGNVVVTTPRGERLTGDRVDADLRLSEMRIIHEVHS